MSNDKAKFRRMSRERRARRRHRLGYCVRCFSPQGRYPAGTQFVHEGVFHADEEVVFSLVRGSSWERLDCDVPYSEFNWALPQELRLWAALMFCEKIGEPRMCLYPVTTELHWLEVRNLEMNNQTVQRVRRLLLEETEYTLDYPSARPMQAGQRILRRFDLFEDKMFALDRLASFWLALDNFDYLILRAAHAMIKSDMLTRHREFREEAVIVLYIALEASFSYIKDILILKGNSNPSAHDVALWLHEEFDADWGLDPSMPGVGYFSEFYEDRIMTMHPSSRFGEMPYAPLMNDDYIHLRCALREIFAYLVSDAHGADRIELLAKHGGMGKKGVR